MRGLPLAFALLALVTRCVRVLSEMVNHIGRTFFLSSSPPSFLHIHFLKSQSKQQANVPQSSKLKSKSFKSFKPFYKSFVVMAHSKPSRTSIKKEQPFIKKEPSPAPESRPVTLPASLSAEEAYSYIKRERSSAPSPSPGLFIFRSIPGPTERMLKLRLVVKPAVATRKITIRFKAMRPAQPLVRKPRLIVRTPEAPAPAANERRLRTKFIIRATGITVKRV